MLVYQRVSCLQATIVVEIWIDISSSASVIHPLAILPIEGAVVGRARILRRQWGIGWQRRWRSSIQWIAFEERKKKTTGSQKSSSSKSCFSMVFPVWWWFPPNFHVIPESMELEHRKNQWTSRKIYRKTCFSQQNRGFPPTFFHDPRLGRGYGMMRS